MGKVLFYDLLAGEKGRYLSPNTWKIRLALLHKQVDFETRDVTIKQLRTELAPEMGVERALGPCEDLV